MDKRGLKVFVRYDNEGKIIAGSLVLRDKLPIVGKWREIQGYECCNYIPTTTIPPPRIKYGALYNWYTVLDIRGVASSGWHVPSDDELIDFTLYCGTVGVFHEDNAGEILKETGTTHWIDPNFGATNETGFTFLPGGYRNPVTGAFVSLLQEGYMWSSTQNNSSTAWSRGMSYLDGGAFSYYNSKKTGASIRLIKDYTSLTEGEIGSYTGNDGKIYPTICIDNKEWLSVNLTETKYRNGDLIIEVTNQASWITLTEGAWCYYNNDPSNAYL